VVSYKAMYEKLLEKVKKLSEPIKTEFLCPLCEESGEENIILESMGEYYCSCEGCRFDLTPDELWTGYAEERSYTRVD